MLARMGVALEPAARPMPSQMLSELKELNLARQALIKDRTAAKNREKMLNLPLLKRQNAQRRKQIETQITAIEAEIQTRIASDEQLAERLVILESIPGISKITAFALLIEMPELGTLEGKQAASLAGLAPLARQSGRWTGRAFIRGDRPAYVRRSICRLWWRPDSIQILKAKYRQFIEARKPAKACPRESGDRNHSNHAKAYRPRKRTLAGWTSLGRKSRLIKTDTLSSRSRNHRACRPNSRR